MNVELVEAAISLKPAIRQMMELYQYEFSPIEQRDLDEQGRYGYFWLDAYWEEDDRMPYIIRCDSRLAGFAFVRMLSLDDDLPVPADYSIAEFFVLKKYRRLGVGRMCALTLFRRFTGRWVLTVYDQNEAADAFWRSVISEVSGDLSMTQRSDAEPARRDYAFSSGNTEENLTRV